MDFSHIDAQGRASMVDVSGKELSVREAVAAGKIFMQAGTLAAIVFGKIPKGEVLSTARIAGIMAAKRTSELIPLCHQIPLDVVNVELTANQAESCLEIQALARCTGKTGVEMEALTAVAVTALTVYDMCKAVDQAMTISAIALLKKTGGKSGDYEKK